LQREIAHLLIDSGANLIVGCHSHCVGPIETYKDSKIYYSLGNFYFPDLKVAYKEGDGTLSYIVKRQRKRNKTSLIVDIDSNLCVSHRYCSNSKDKITQVSYSDKNIWSNFPKTFERFRAKILWNLDNPWIVIRKIKRVLHLVK